MSLSPWTPTKLQQEEHLLAGEADDRDHARLASICSCLHALAPELDKLQTV